MNEFEQQPDDLWRKAFDEATETPPPRVWDAIERRLDESEGPRVLPIWGTAGASRPLWWGAGLAAAVSLLLVGWWALNHQTIRDAGMSVAQVNKPQLGSTRPSRTRPDAPSVQAPTSSAGQRSRSADARPTSAGHSPVLAFEVDRPIVAQQLKAPISAAAQRPTDSLAQADAQTLNPTAPRLTEPMPAPAAALVAGQPVSQPTETPAPVTRSVNSVAFVPASPTAVVDPAASSTNTAPQPAASQPAARRESIQSALADDVLSAEPQAQPKRTRAAWASISLMPGAFNPVVALQTANTSPFTNVAAFNYARTSVPTVNSQANFSVAYQASVGIQLGERWSVESGVGYLSGRSTVHSPAQTSFYAYRSNDQTGAVTSNLYVDALRSQVSVARVADPTANADQLVTNNYHVLTTYSDPVRQTLTNDYQYVQVPVQIGYQLRPRKRLGLALLGGFLTNIFVRNTVADDVVITSKAGVYRPVSWAASMGARFRYRPSRRWSASLAGLYQPSLGLGTRPGSVVRSQPTSVGMSLGVDYHFNSLP